MKKTAIFACAAIFIACFLKAETWQMKDGKEFDAQITECDAETATFKPMGKPPFKIYLRELEDDAASRAILAIYKNKYADAVSKLRKIASSSNDVIVGKEHIPYINDIGIYLREASKPISKKFKPEGEFDDSDDYWTRIHSGMLYFALTYIEELCLGEEMMKINEFRRPKLKNVVDHISDFNQFFSEIAKGKNYAKNRPGQQFPVKIKPKDYINNFQPYHYWVYIPQNYEKAEKLTSVFYLCGRGEFGTNLDAILTHELPKLLLKRKDYPFIVISPQDNDVIARPPYYNEILSDAKKRFKIDEDRLICTGISSGGAGAWRWALRNPDLFAGIVPISGVMPHEEITQLKELPIWLYNNEMDKVWIQDLCISKMSKINPNFKSTIFADAEGHSAWVKAYLDPKLEVWMSQLVRKKNGDNHKNPVDELKYEENLSKPQVKTENAASYLTFEIEQQKHKTGKYDQIRMAHEARSGSLYDWILNDFSEKIYKFEHFELKHRCSQPIVRFVNENAPEIYTYGIDIRNFQKVDVKEPFSIRQYPNFKCFSAYYLNENPDPAAAIARLKRLAREAGHTLTGMNRIIYRQALVADRNFYEIQLGIR